MEIKQLLPLLLKGRLGEKEQAILKLAETHDPAALTSALSQLVEQQKNAPRIDEYATLKRIIPDELLGRIIKYEDSLRRGDS